MIIIIEIEAIIKSIEERYAKSGDNIPNKSLDVVNVLKMTIGEIRELYRLLTKSMKLNAKIELENLRLMNENVELHKQIAINTAILKETNP